MQTTVQDPTLEQIDGQTYKAATPEQIKAALTAGRALITLRSHATGKHVTILVTGRKKKDGGKGWVSRATKEGRVGLENGADALQVTDILREYPEDYVGRLYTDSMTWKAGQAADPIRVYAAEKVLAYALDGIALQSEVFLATTCTNCGKQLWDPESIEDQMGPECKGKVTASVVAH